MATGFIQLNENDTKELRKEIGLPVTKGVIYWSKEVSGVWKKYNVVDYKIVASYEPSGSKSILITLENESQIRILSDYLVDMQKASLLKSQKIFREKADKELKATQRHMLLWIWRQQEPITLKM